MQVSASMVVMTPPLTHPERVAVARLHALLELLPTALDKRLRPAGITSFEYTLLETLTESPDQFLRMSEVAAKTNATLPRISRVVSSLEKRDLITRVRCAEDARATNLQLTELGAHTYEHSRELYAAAVRELILTGVASLPDDGTSQLADLSYAILSSLDPERKGGFAHSDTCAADPGPERACAADPAADPATDPAPTADCAADPAPAVECSADPQAFSAAHSPMLRA